jgi:bleomycin hydrolase
MSNFPGESLMKSVLIAAGLILFTGVSTHAQAPGHLDPALLGELERSCVPDAALRAAQHTLAQVDGNKVSQNWEKIISVDQYFSLRLKDQKITDQKGTGRCWMFSGLNVVRPVASNRLNCDDLELSQNYLYFYEKLEKANIFLNEVIRTKEQPFTDRPVENLLKTTVQDGQNWYGFVELVKKYGVVPKEVMPETFSSSNSGHVNFILSLRLKQAAVKIRHEADPSRVQELRLGALKDVYRILIINFGEPPKVFTWRYETKEKRLSALHTYTPQQFFREAVGDELDDYCALYSIPTLPFARKYEIDLDRTVSDRPNLAFVNCPLQALKDAAKASLLDSAVVWFGCDVGQQSSIESGVMSSGVYDYESLYNMNFSMSRKELFETYSSIPTHNMVFTGIDIVDGNVKKWLVENSWGDTRGKKGYLMMVDDWFDHYVQEVVVHKKYVTKDILAVFETGATVLPAWDPMMMFLEERN